MARTVALVAGAAGIGAACARRLAVMEQQFSGGVTGKTWWVEAREAKVG